MTPTSKAASPYPSPSKAAPPRPPSIPSPAMVRMIPPLPRGSGGYEEEESQAAGPPARQECSHKEVTRRGTNAYIDMITCKLCGKVLHKAPKEKKDEKMRTQEVSQCQHHDVTWKGTNAHIWQWNCKDCGRVEKIKKEPGRDRPSPSSGHMPSTPPRAMASSSMTPPSQPQRSPILASGSGETMFHSLEDWMHYRELLERMVNNHMMMNGSMTHQEFMHVINATLLCYRTFSYTTMQEAIPNTTTSRSTRSSVVADDDARIFSFGKHKGQRFDQVYELHPDYVDWTLREMEQSEGYCQGMKRWMKYCRERVNEEIPTTAYMVTDEDGEDEEGLYLYLDSGCNHTCHGELWLRKFVDKTGYEPPWLHQEEKELNGIGGKTKTLGEREFYIRLETTIGTQVPGEIASTEIQGSSAPMLLSLPSQASLGLVVDAESGTVYSKWLEKYCKVVRGPRNRLIGLKRITTHRQEDEIEEMGIVIIPEDEEQAEENAASSSHVEERHTEEVREVPKRRRTTYQVKEVPRRPSEETWMDEERRRAEEIEEDDVAAYYEEDVEEEEPAVETSPEDQPDDEDDPAVVREDHTGEEDLEEHKEENEDFWEHTEDGRLIRYHVVPRNKHFAPTGSRLDLPVDLARLKDERVTRKYYEDQSRHIETDSWRKEEVEKFVKNSYNAIHYQRGPHGVHLKRRVTRDLDTGEQLADEDENQLSDKTSLTRALDKMRNLTTDFYFYEEYPEGKPWTGQTEFKIKPLDEELQESRYRLEPDDQARTLKRGQRKHLSEVAGAMEERDVAMWNILTRRPPKMMKSWKFLLELFAGCAVLTQMAQAMGYETCVPLDKHTGWDVFKAEHRRYAEDILDKEQPYLLAIAFPCGPWSPWQNLAKDREAVLQRRKLWLPVLRWIKQMVIKQRNRGGVSLLENPWTSQAWNTKELEYLEENFGGETETRRYEVLRVDLCQLGLRDADSGKPHKKATGVGTDSPGVQAVMRSVPRCDGRHEHQVLEGSNSRGSRTRQAAKWTRRFCRRIIRGVQQDLEEMTRVAFAAEDRQEELEEKPGKMDAVYGPEDLPTSSVGQGAEMEKDLQLQEDMEAIRREGDPEDEKVRRQECYA